MTRLIRNHNMTRHCRNHYTFNIYHSQIYDTIKKINVNTFQKKISFLNSH